MFGRVNLLHRRVPPILLAPCRLAMSLAAPADLTDAATQIPRRRLARDAVLEDDDNAGHVRPLDRTSTGVLLNTDSLAESNGVTTARGYR